MACFLVPVAEAVVTTAITKTAKAKEGTTEQVSKIPFARKLKWLTNMLWGGSALLAFEHIWHGEVTPGFPFLTAAADPVEASIMLNEMVAAGVTMAVLITAVWGIMLLVANSMERKELEAQSATN